MSSVGSSDSADRGGDKAMLRRVREEARQRESDLVKRQNIEVRHLNERHEDEIERIKTENSERTDQLKAHSNDAISARDHRYQREMEDFRTTARRQLQTVADDNQRQNQALRKSIDAEAKSREKHNDERFTQLNKDFTSKNDALEANFAARSAEQKKSQGEALNHLRDKLNESHGDETEMLRDTLQDKLAHTEKSFADYRKKTGQEWQDERVRDLRTSARAGTQLMDAVRGEREARQDNEDRLLADYRDSLGEARDRYRDALQAHIDADADSSLDFRAHHNDRDEKRVGSLEKENREIREQATRNEAKLRHQAGEELKNAKSEFQRNVDAYRRERDDAYKQAHSGKKDDWTDAREKLERRLVENTRDYRDQIKTQADRSRNVFDNLKGDFDARVQSKEQLADARVARIADRANDEHERMIERERDNHEMLQRTKHEEIKALRGTLEDDKQTAIEQMRDLMRRQEVKHQERLGVVVGKYDKQIQSLKDGALRERKMNAENTKRLTEEMQRAHQVELDQAEAKSRAKLDEINGRHDQETRDLTKRYEEKLDQVFAEVKKSEK